MTIASTPVSAPVASALLEAVLGSLTDGVLVVDAEGRYVCHNQRFLDLWRISPALAAGADPRAWLRHAAAQVADPEAFVARVRALRDSPEAVSHDLLEFADGRVFERYTRPWHAEGRIAGRLWTFSDCTDARLTDLLVRESVERLALDARAAERLAMETGLRRALARGELALVYQPQVSLRTGRVEGFEALVRWRHPQRGLVLPSEFVPVAEASELVVELGRWVLAEACRQVRAWRDAHPGMAVPRVSVNVSARHLSHPSLVDDVRAALAAAGVEGAALRVEITESVLAGPGAAVAEALRALRALGVGLCLDDFGTGYSSLAYLHRFPVDALKVDRSFVGRLGAERESGEIVRTILSLARSLAMDVVAEGIETDEQRAILEALGCEHAQGFLFSAPLDAQAAIGLVTAR